MENNCKVQSIELCFVSSDETYIDFKKVDKLHFKSYQYFS